MKEKIKEFLRAVTPPVIRTIYQKICSPVKVFPTEEVKKIISFEGVYMNWSSAIENSGGYDSDEIISKVLTATIKVKNGEAVFERDSVLFDRIEYVWPVITGLLLATARASGYLNVLDYGGALGSSYFQNRKFLTKLKDIRWNVVEQTHFVKAGKLEIESDQLRFHESISDCLIDNNPNVVLLSSVLQYLPEPYDVLNDILAINSDLIILDRTCYSNDTDGDELYIQNILSTIYSASYPCWFLSESKLMKLMNEGGYSLIEEFPSLDRLDERASWKGHIFIRKLNG